MINGKTYKAFSLLLSKETLPLSTPQKKKKKSQKTNVSDKLENGLSYRK